MKKNIVILVAIFAGALLVGALVHAKFSLKKAWHSTTHAVESGAKSVSKGAKSVGKGVESGAKSVGKGIEKSAIVVGKGIEKGAIVVGEEIKKDAKVVAQKMKDAANTVAECGQAAAYGAQFAGTTALQAAADSVGGALDKIFSIKSISIEGNSSKLLGQGALPEVTVTGNLLGKSVSFNVALNIGDSAESVAAIVKQVMKLL